MDKFPTKTLSVAELTVAELTTNRQPPPDNTPHLHNRPGKTRPHDWVASRLPLPGADETPNKVAVPDAVFWLDGDGLIKDIALLEPGNEIEQIKTSFSVAIHSANGGAVGAPKTLRTDSTELISLLKPLHPTIDYVLGEVPEVYGVAEHLSAHLENRSDRIPTYKDLDIPLSTIASFYDAATKLHKKKPWNKIASPQHLIGISIESMGIQDHVISLLGQDGPGQDGHGQCAILYKSLSDYEWFCFVISCADPTRFREIPPHRSLNYISGSNLHPEQRKEIMENGWRVASSSAYPELFHTEGHQVAVKPTAEDFELLDALARGLTELMNDTSKLKRCWQHKEHWKVSKNVTTSSGNVDIVFQVPALPSGKTLDNLNPLERLALIDHTDTIDADILHDRLIEEITDEFQQSSEFKSLAISGTMVPILMDFAFNYTGLTIASLPPIGLEDILYEYIPRKVMVDPSEAAEIVDDFFAFYQFLKRAYQFRLADEFLSILNNRAKRELSVSLSDPDKFGMAKTLFPDEQTAPESWHLLQETNTRCLQPKTNRSKIKAANNTKNRKKKRKSARKARKRSS